MTTADAVLPPVQPARPAPHSLAEVEVAVWRELARAVRDKSHGWRIGVLATTDGEAADARHVVLRDVDRAAREVIVYTDARSPKVQQIAGHPQGTLVLWSEALGWQLRLRVALKLETEGLIVSSRWARLKMTPGARDYMSPLAPGSTVAHPSPQRSSRAHFAVLVAMVQSLDWLDLDAEGHRRAGFDAGGARWLAP